MTTIRKPGPTIKVGVISALATKVGVLPNDYRSFLLMTNGGVPEERRIPEPSDIGIGVSGFFSLGDATSGDLSMTRALETWAGRYPDGYVPIARCEGSNLLLMATGDEHAGRVVYWDHDGEAERRRARAHRQSHARRRLLPGTDRSLDRRCDRRRRGAAPARRLHRVGRPGLQAHLRLSSSKPAGGASRDADPAEHAEHAPTGVVPLRRLAGPRSLGQPAPRVSTRQSATLVTSQ